MKRYVFALVAAVATPASAQQTTTYTYDSLGRLSGSVVASGATGQTTTVITYDAAGNRTTYEVATSGSSGGSAGSGATPPGGGTSGGAGTSPTPIFVVVPLNGFTVIPIQPS